VSTEKALEGAWRITAHLEQHAQAHVMLQLVFMMSWQQLMMHLNNPVSSNPSACED
jgi:hypothetical protein